MASGGARVFNGCRTLFAAAKSATPKLTATSTAAAPKKTKTSAVKKSPVTKDGSTEKKPSGILKPCPISPALSDFLGVPESARTDAVKKIWDYIKLHQLQNPTNKKEIICDEKLKTIFDGKDKVGILEIAKLISPHFVKTT